ncbi:hypothetical protein EVJ58_g8868 [Rhodofomes roseus]|uniref:DUF6535 domain-containing protein n=1 Tax=Rhodofomes roseus TaxID=34475 RepID=A0A4Y9XXD0_9APHY|nr:hypothetical protein EVJ58_g8868 [Rhodofomes roseus]
MARPSDSDTSAQNTPKQNISTDRAWAQCAKDVWSDEADRVKTWNDEIDTLLVFAGLFSAILTAFVVQYYPTLQASGGAQPQIIIISTPDSANLTVSYPAPPPTPVTASAIAINALWFVALVFSITSASLGISVKQWLAHYIPSESDIGDARLRLHIWRLRSRGLARWHVPEIIGLLPLLLQVALALFLVGLVLFLWTLNGAIAYLMMVLISVLLAFTAATALIPLVEIDYSRPNVIRVRKHNGPSEARATLATCEIIADSASGDSIGRVAVSLLKTILTAREHATVTPEPSITSNSFPPLNGSSMVSRGRLEHGSSVVSSATISNLMSVIYSSTSILSTPLDSATRAAITPFLEWLQDRERTRERDQLIWDILFAELSTYLGAQTDSHTEVYRAAMVSAIVEMLLQIIVCDVGDKRLHTWRPEMYGRLQSLCDVAFSTGPELFLRVIKERPDVVVYIEHVSISRAVFTPSLDTVICLVRCSVELSRQAREGTWVLHDIHHRVGSSAVRFIAAGSIPHPLELEQSRRVKSELISCCLIELRMHGHGTIRLPLIHTPTLADVEYREVCIAARSALDAAKPPMNAVHSRFISHYDEMLGRLIELHG